MILVLLGGTGTLSTAILEEQELLHQNNISKIRVISRDEIKQDSLEKNYRGQISLQCFLGDVRDLKRMEFALKGADYVIHTAALKMIERFERDIPEGFETNISGSLNVATAAIKNHLKSAILVSTDKAFKPTTAYGVSKLAAQHLWLWHNTFQKISKFGVSAYGNVAGSRGSVLELWHYLAKTFQPLPVTDPEMTRFFILKQEAAKFVLTSLFQNDSQIMIPKMKSTNMLALAHKFNEFYHSPAGVKYIGRRDPREKMHEDLGELNSYTCERYTDKELEDLVCISNL